MLTELYWEKYPILYPRFNVVIVGEPDITLINFLKRIMPDKTTVEKVSDTSTYDNMKKFKNFIQTTFPSYIESNKFDENSLYTPVPQNKEDKFRITYGDIKNNGILSYADMIFFLNGNDVNEYLQRHHSISIGNFENIKDDIYYVVDKRRINLKVCFTYKLEYDRYQ